ncbi:hypothetical protein NDU88_005272 [Pleurodeles waltl]|uniref:Uncharacterized protein n=1 Tax=Pleurodeles waltl TaxID=8319 RepID=A0AAV7N5C2_PLEWA|nr:hypothetical protein NDU88_005272 [Pleurodeles waltl]
MVPPLGVPGPSATELDLTLLDSLAGSHLRLSSLKRSRSVALGCHTGLAGMSSDAGDSSLMQRRCPKQCVPTPGMVAYWCHGDTRWNAPRPRSAETVGCCRFSFFPSS